MRPPFWHWAAVALAAAAGGALALVATAALTSSRAHAQPMSQQRCDEAYDRLTEDMRALRRRLAINERMYYGTGDKTRWEKETATARRDMDLLNHDVAKLQADCPQNFPARGTEGDRR